MESKDFSDMVKSKENREKFITNAIEFLRAKGFDGIDLGKNKIYDLNIDIFR
jgi:GH18 family chitinase